MEIKKANFEPETATRPLPTVAGVTLGMMLEDLPLHQNFYLRGVINSFRTAFMPSNRRTLTEDDISGEALELLRDVVNKVAPDLPDGFVAKISYEDINKHYNLGNVFRDKNFDLSGFQEQMKMALGGFDVRRDGDRLIVEDTYDFPPPGEWQQYSNLKTASDYIKASEKEPEKRVYFSARFLAERTMAEGSDDNMPVRIVIPPEPNVVNIDFDDDPPEGAADFVFRGPMTNKRKSLWDKFTSMFVTPAEAQVNDNDPSGVLENDLQRVRVMQLKGKNPFPMDGNDEYGRMNDAQRKIADMDLSEFDE